MKLKIKLPNNDMFLTEVPEEIDFQHLPQITDKLNKIIKYFGRDELMATASSDEFSKVKEKKKYRYYTPMSSGSFSVKDMSREQAIEFIKLYYFGSDEEKEAFAIRHNTSWKPIMFRVYAIRKKYSILPQEIGIKKFPDSSNFAHFRLNKEAWRVNSQ